jgi:hypothetical protein
MPFYQRTANKYTRHAYIAFLKLDKTFWNRSAGRDRRFDLTIMCVENLRDRMPSIIHPRRRSETFRNDKTENIIVNSTQKAPHEQM